MVHAYLSGPIIHAASRKDDFCRMILDILEENGITVFVPQFLPDAKAREVYERDTYQLRMADFLIGEVSKPSHGVGMEIMLAIELMKPVILFRNRDSEPISKMIVGAYGKALFEYSDLVEVRSILQAINFESLIVQKCPSCNSHVVEVTESGMRCIQCGFDAF